MWVIPELQVIIFLELENIYVWCYYSRVDRFCYLYYQRLLKVFFPAFFAALFLGVLGFFHPDLL